MAVRPQSQRQDERVTEAGRLGGDAGARPHREIIEGAIVLMVALATSGTPATYLDNGTARNVRYGLQKPISFRSGD